MKSRDFSCNNSDCLLKINIEVEPSKQAQELEQDDDGVLRILEDKDIDVDCPKCGSLMTAGRGYNTGCEGL